MDGVSIYVELGRLTDEAEALSDELDALDLSAPRAEMAYQVRKCEVELELRRTMGATVARDTVRGDPEVAQLRLERDMLSNRRQTVRERLAQVRAQLYIYEGMARREWTRPSNQ